MSKFFPLFFVLRLIGSKKLTSKHDRDGSLNKSIKCKIGKSKNFNSAYEHYSINNCALLERAFITFTYHSLSCFFFFFFTKRRVACIHLDKTDRPCMTLSRPSLSSKFLWCIYTYTNSNLHLRAVIPIVIRIVVRIGLNWSNSADSTKLCKNLESKNIFRFCLKNWYLNRLI